MSSQLRWILFFDSPNVVLCRTSHKKNTILNCLDSSPLSQSGFLQLGQQALDGGPALVAAQPSLRFPVGSTAVLAFIPPGAFPSFIRATVEIAKPYWVGSQRFINSFQNGSCSLDAHKGQEVTHVERGVGDSGCSHVLGSSRESYASWLRFPVLSVDFYG